MSAAMQTVHRPGGRVRCYRPLKLAGAIQGALQSRRALVMPFMVQGCLDPAALYGSAYRGAPAARTPARKAVSAAESDPIQTLAASNLGAREQAALLWPALSLSRRGGRCRSTHSRSLVGYAGDQVIDSGEEHSQNRGRVRLVISDHQIDGRRLAF